MYFRIPRQFRRSVLISIALYLAATHIPATGQAIVKLEPTGPQPIVFSPQGKAQSLYTASYALLVSESNYLGTARQGWRSLGSTKAELDRVAVTLQAHGFTVWRVNDATSEDLPRVFRRFISSFGHVSTNRLLFFFSGHGYTNPANDVGYLVPVDAKDPSVSPEDFYDKALPIETIQVWAKEIESKHALFIFDSCFSGGIFTTKGTVSRPEDRGQSDTERWRYLSNISHKPVRQFLAAGGPAEVLPARSVFVPLFIQALEGSASRSRDGYVTGKEIGLWIEQTLPSMNPSQNPHSDVIRVPELAFGDIVFQYTGLAKDVGATAVIRPTEGGTRSAVTGTTSPSPAQRTQLTVYTALETEQIKAYEAAFNGSQPAIELKWVRDSANVILAKLLAERANPKADVVMGVAASSLALLGVKGMLIPYAPSGVYRIPSKFRDKQEPPEWFGMDGWGATVCFNTVEAARRGLPKPATWKDLTKAVYKGQIVMPNPSSSGTGYLDVIGWLTLWGDDNGAGGGWNYMDALHRNIAQYTHSGSKPCNMAASGAYVIGISFEQRASINKSRGAPIELVFPTEGLGWELEAFAILKGTRNLAAAQALADWASGGEAMALYGMNFAITAQTGVAKPIQGIPADYEKRLINIDFTIAGANRERILAEWTRRYDAKSEPKQ